MLLAHRLWAQVDEGETASFGHWQQAHAAALAELEPEFDAAWRGFDTSEQKTMRAVIAGAGCPYKADVRNRLDLTKDMVRKALPRLRASAELELVDGKLVVVDPLFAEWIERLTRAAPSSRQTRSRAVRDGHARLGQLALARRQQVVREEPGFRELLEIRELAVDAALDRNDACSRN